MEKRRKGFNKMGQVTIFIIVGILIVAAIVSVFIFQNKLGISTRFGTNPTTFIETCARDNIEPMVESIISTGGVYYSGSNNEQFLVKNDSKFAILCTTNASETSCTNTHPLIIDEIQYEIKRELISKINSCFTQLKKKYPNVEISEGELEFSVELVRDTVLVKIRKPLTFISGEDSNSFNNFDINLNSKVYNFVELTNLIVNAESSCNCNTKTATSGNANDSILYMDANGTTNPFFVSKPSANCDVNLAQLNKNYPDYIFTRVITDNSEKIYTIESLVSPEQNFSFVVKNCVPGCNGPDGLCYHHYHEGGLIHYSSIIDSCHNQIHHYHDTEEYIID